MSLQHEFLHGFLQEIFLGFLPKLLQELLQEFSFVIYQGFLFHSSVDSIRNFSRDFLKIYPGLPSDIPSKNSPKKIQKFLQKVKYPLVPLESPPWITLEIILGICLKKKTFRYFLGTPSQFLRRLSISDLFRNRSIDIPAGKCPGLFSGIHPENLVEPPNNPYHYFQRFRIPMQEFIKRFLQDFFG